MDNNNIENERIKIAQRQQEFQDHFFSDPIRGGIFLQGPCLSGQSEIVISASDIKDHFPWCAYRQEYKSSICFLASRRKLQNEFWMLFSRPDNIEIEHINSYNFPVEIKGVVIVFRWAFCMEYAKYNEEIQSCIALAKGDNLPVALCIDPKPRLFNPDNRYYRSIVDQKGNSRWLMVEERVIETIYHTPYAPPKSSDFENMRRTFQLEKDCPIEIIDVLDRRDTIDAMERISAYFLSKNI